LNFVVKQCAQFVPLLSDTCLLTKTASVSRPARSRTLSIPSKVYRWEQIMSYNYLHA